MRIHPDVFELDDDGQLQVSDAVGPEDRADLEQAVDACPTLALSLG